MSKIRIGLDFHGVIDTNPSYFKGFCSAAISIGWEIFIITGGPYEKVKTLLEKWQIPYSEIFATYDYYDKLGKVKKEGEKFFVDEDLWNTIKGKYCKDNKIDVQIDDSGIYGNGFSTPYCHFDENSKSCTLQNGLTLDFTKPVAETLNLIAQRLANF